MGTSALQYIESKNFVVSRSVEESHHIILLHNQAPLHNWVSVSRPHTIVVIVADFLYTIVMVHTSHRIF